MSFKSIAVALGTSNTDVVECPATMQGAAVLMVGNITAGALTYAIKVFRQATGQTVTIATGVSVAANTVVKIPAPISLEAGDKVIMTSSSANNLLVTGTFTYSAATPAAKGYTPKGPWDDEATYETNDVVELNGTSYASMQDDNLNQNPETQTDYWMVNAAKGETGDGDLTAANNLSDLADVATAFGNIKQAASDTATGVVELATAAEVATGTDAARAVTPAGAAAVYLPRKLVPRDQSGTSYTFVIGDAEVPIRSTSGTATAWTIPPNSSVAFPIGTTLYVTQGGAGALSFVAGAGVTIESEDGMLSAATRYVWLAATKRATDTWMLYGALR